MRTRDKLVHIRISDDEHEIILENAKKLNLPLAPYVRTVALNPVINIVDFKIIDEHTKEIAEIRNAINRLVFTIEATNNYLPKEIDSIVDMMREVFRSENALIKEVRKARYSRPEDLEELYSLDEIESET